MNKDQLPFLFGAQYYRAPTPEKEFWAEDLAKMKDIGFNQVKYWMQWRWQHRAPDRFYWDDLDRLMDLAAKNSVGVTINIIMDVSPLWLFEKYPDARQVDSKGNPVETFAVQHRQIGGQPGPCHTHPGALLERKKFFHAAIEHFRSHPAMRMWDVWNEPEQSYPRRDPIKHDLTCFCYFCRGRFIEWLQNKYVTLERINEVWGRCYETWHQVEIPRTEACVTDFIDWREFHLDTMTSEAKWKLDLVRKLDPKSVSYLHVVPNTMHYFNSAACVDDFDFAEHCDIWAATMNQNPVFTTQVISAVRGKVCYNVESHVNFGSLRNHQRILDLQDLLTDWLPQIGLGVKGFLFWQFRPEVIGTESPAWGLVRADGSDRPITEAVRTFWNTLWPHTNTLMKCPARQGEIGIFKSRKNELFHACMDRKFSELAGGIDAYLQNLYWMNYPTRFVSGQMLERGDLAGIKLLILPSAIYLTEDEVVGLDQWVRAGGVALCEAHLASYNSTRGRHARQMPGIGLNNTWGIHELDSTATHHLKFEQMNSENLDAAQIKAMQESGAVGGEFVPVRLSSGTIAWGGSRYAILQAPDAQTLGSFDGQHPTIVLKSIGKGAVLYCGTNLGQGAERDAGGLREILTIAADRAAVKHTLSAVSTGLTSQVHVDVLEHHGDPHFVLIWNRSMDTEVLKLDLRGKLSGLFTGRQLSCDGSSVIQIAPKLIDLFVFSKN